MNDRDLTLAEIAHMLECITEEELCQLAAITPSTAEAWRKRHIGPDYALIGNTFLYPTQQLREYLSTRVRRMSSEERENRPPPTQRGKLGSVFDSDLDD